MLRQILAAMLVVALVLGVNRSVSPATDISSKYSRELQCLAENIYHEARNQSLMGRMAVAFVTVNRSKSDQHSKDICKVVYEKTNSVCQFSWVCQPQNRITNFAAYQDALRIAKMVLLRYNEIIDPTEGALYFHAVYVSPSWAKSFIKTVRIDDHIFYKQRAT